LSDALQQGFATSETGFWGSLYGNDMEPLMSALGHKRTLGRLYVMSALPPKADIVGRDDDVRYVPKADIRIDFCA